METGHCLGAGTEECLRRVVVTRKLSIVPEAIAATLLSVGFAEKNAAGELLSTAEGKEYLEERGIATNMVRGKRA
jgi:hypothetical protein